MFIRQKAAYLRWSKTLLGQLVDLVLDLNAGQLQPGGDRPSVGEGTLGDTLAWCVHTTHVDGLNALKRWRTLSAMAWASFWS